LGGQVISGLSVGECWADWHIAFNWIGHVHGSGS
jgi:hypothetical protein